MSSVPTVVMTRAPYSLAIWIEAVPMPPSIIAWLSDFVGRHHKDEKFVKRRRERVDAGHEMLVHEASLEPDDGQKIRACGRKGSCAVGLRRQHNEICGTHDVQHRAQVEENCPKRLPPRGA